MDFLPDDYLVITLRLLMAALLSGLIGMEREMKKQPAGLRTHLLVGIGSCLMMLLSITGFDYFLKSSAEPIRFDPSRIPSYVISGIGFLGAGTIIVHGKSVKGLATAASIWVAAGLGLVVGIGMYYVAVLATFIVLLVLFVLGKLEKKYIPSSKKRQITVIAEDQGEAFSKISHLFEDHQLNILDFYIEEGALYGDKNISKYIFSIEAGHTGREMELVKDLQSFSAVIKVII